MLKRKMPFEEYSDADMIIEMIKCIGKMTPEDRSAAGFKDYKKFTFPKMRK
jgi:hypothetical protein